MMTRDTSTLASGLAAGLTLRQLLHDMDEDKLRAGELLEACWANRDEKDDPQAQVYTACFEKTARAESDAADALLSAGVPVGELAGLPIALKVLFDVAGEVTHAGSRWWREPAVRDATIVTRLRRAGAVIAGHTNMTEFAYSGLGLNPHYGTPDNPLAPGRIPGGSSCGAAVAVARGMAAAAIGTDTGGSVRIPAAFCGLVGFKPSQWRIPREGAFPLSDSLDSVGPLARSVACCARLDAVMAGRAHRPLRPYDLRGRRFVVPQTYMLDGIDDTVAEAFDRSLRQLRAAGAEIVDAPAPVLGALPELMEGGGFTAAESYFVHRHWLAEHADSYDPRVRTRIEKGAGMLAADYLELCRRRQVRMREADAWLQEYDGMLAPTVPIVPPRLQELESDEAYTRLNLLVLRNPTVANLLDLCAITLPSHADGELPSGLMLVGRNGQDDNLLRQGQAMEDALRHSC